MRILSKIAILVMLVTGASNPWTCRESYYRARYYDPAIGRFTSNDPSGFLAGTNFYGYVDSNPTNRIDPMGLDWIEYTGQTLTVWPGKFKDRGQPPLLVCKATSGMPNYQNSMLEDREFGPVPRGHYWINTKLDPNRWASMMPSGGNLYAAFGVQNVHETYIGANGLSYSALAWGTWRARLEPRSVLNTGRSNFYIHNSTKGYTHGCIETCDRLHDMFVTYHDQGLAGIDVLVDYTTMSTNGGTRKP